MTHARLSPSNHRWVFCPGSVREEANYPNTTSEAAIEGTGVHLLIEMALLSHKCPKDFKGQIIGQGHKDKPQGWKVTDDRISKADYLFAYLKRHEGAEVEPESKSNPGVKFGRDDWYGTADVTLRKDNYLEVVDYKNGRGYVSEKDNSQLISYGYGKWDGEENVRLTIVQPKTMPPIRYVDLTGVELESEAKKLAEAAAKTDDPNAPLHKGEWCHWCKHKPNCNEYNKVAEDVMLHSGLQEHFSKLVENVQNMSDSELTDILDAEAIVSALFDKARAEAEARVEAGTKLNGWAMKPGRTSRNWKDEEAVKAFLKEKKVKVSEFMESKLRSPAQIEKFKKISSEELKDFIEEKAGSMKLSKTARVKF